MLIGRKIVATVACKLLWRVETEARVVQQPIAWHAPMPDRSEQLIDPLLLYEALRNGVIQVPELDYMSAWIQLFDRHLGLRMTSIRSMAQFADQPST